LDRQRALTPEAALAAGEGVHRRARGGYAVVALVLGLGLVAFRDPNGIRPLVLGRRGTEAGTECAVASESVALDILGFERLRAARRRGPLGRGRGAAEAGTGCAGASESVALDILGCERVRDGEPGEGRVISAGGELHARRCAEPGRSAPCIFEYVYFARPDSMIENISVHKARMRMGVTLGEKILREWPDHDIDVVIPIPDTSRDSAMELANVLGV